MELEAPVTARRYLRLSISSSLSATLRSIAALICCSSI